MKTQVLVMGSGPGGYTAAFRAADLGQKVILVERYATLGGVCLNVGCIPSKALLHVQKVIDEAIALKKAGVKFNPPKIDVSALLRFKDQIVSQLTGGLATLAKQRKINVVRGTAQFITAHRVGVKPSESDQTSVEIEFEQAIIAVGSRSIRLPFLPEDPRIVDSTGALALPDCPVKMLIIGGGIIGLEMATIYSALGHEVTVVEVADQLIAGADPDLVAPLHQRLKKSLKKIWLNTTVTQVLAKPDGCEVSLQGPHDSSSKIEKFDRILYAVGRRPNADQLNLSSAGIAMNEKGYLQVDQQMRTNIPHIFAIGDVVGQPMLAHKASAEGRVTAEVIAGKKHFFMPKCIPSVAYTDPEIAWVGMSETEAKAQQLPYKVAYDKASFPWAANGRSLTMGRHEGITKLLVDPATRRIIGGGIVGPNAGELISEIALAIEMGCDIEDIALTIHPHPTLSETILMAAEVFEGTVTDLYCPKSRAKEAV